MFFGAPEFDQNILLALYHVTSSSPVFTWVAIFFAEWLPYCAVAFLVVYEIFFEDDEQTNLRTFFRYLFPLAVALCFVFVLKFLIQEPRPFVGDLGVVPFVEVLDPFGSFPSAHATFFGVLFGVMFATRFRFLWWYGGIALLVSLGRVMVGVHWPSDVLAGLSLGLVTGGMFGLFFHRHEVRGMVKKSEQ